MVSHVLKSFFILAVVFVSNIVLADDQNSSLINADKTTYINLLQTLKETKVSNDEIALQKVLLTKLINTLPVHQAAALNTPETIDDFSDLFNRYIDDTYKKDSVSKRIKSITTKIKALGNEIESLDNNASSKRTLQLQDALYTKSLREYQAQNEAVSKEIIAMDKMLTESVRHITFDSAALAKQTITNRESASKLRSTIDMFLIKKERFELLGDTRDRGISANTISSKEDTYTKAIRATMTSLFLSFSDALKAKDKKAFVLEQSILDETANLENSSLIKDALASLLHTMEKSYFGTIGTIKESTAQELQNILKKSWTFINEPMFTLNGSPISVLKMILAGIIFLLGIFGGGFYKTNIQKFTMHSKSINLGTRTILANIGYYIIILTAFFIALNVMGIDLSSIALVAGALSVGIGFGLQNIVSNLVSGIILMFERSIKIGDFVELSSTLRGHVFDIRMRSTTLNTNGNIDVIVPNRNFIENNVINWTMHDKLKRFDIPFSVAYGTKPEHVIDILIKAVQKQAYKDVINTKDRYTNVLMIAMGSSSVDFILQVWIHGEEILAPTKTMSRFLILIYNTLNEQGIEIPFPQQDLHIKSIDTSLSLVPKESSTVPSKPVA